MFEDDDFGFLDSYNESFWTQLNLDDISYNVPCEIVSKDFNGSFQSTNATQILDSCAMSPTTSESNIVLDNDFVDFLDAYEDAMVDNLWTESYVANMFHIPSELLILFVAESEYFTPIYNDLWGCHLY